LNLEQVVNFKSAILGVLIQFQRKVEKAGGRLKVVCLDRDILLMFHITKIDLVLDLHPGERLAIDAFRDNTRSWVAMAWTPNKARPEPAYYDQGSRSSRHAEAKKGGAAGCSCLQRRFPRPGKRSIISRAEARFLRGCGRPVPSIVDCFLGR
jgi:hypothetical protein